MKSLQQPTTIDVTNNKIRVIVKSCQYPILVAPLFIEGTVLSITTQSITAIDLFYAGRILEIICSKKVDLPRTNIKVRWDNDVKAIYPAGVFHLRSSNLITCQSIWAETSNIAVDHTPYSELKPISCKQKIYLDPLKKVPQINSLKVLNSLFDLPNQDNKIKFSNSKARQTTIATMIPVYPKYKEPPIVTTTKFQYSTTMNRIVSTIG